MIRAAENTDIETLVEIHMNALPDDLLPSFGARYLSRDFYPLVLMSDYAETWVLEEADRVRAFIIISRNPGRLTTEISRNKFKLIAYLLLKGNANLDTLREIISHIRGLKIELVPGYENLDILSICEIYLIATSPDFQSRGFGTQLMSFSMNKIKDQCKKILTKTSSKIAKSFYLHQGFVAIGSEKRGKNVFYILLRNL